MSRGVKKLIQTKIPNMSRLSDVSDFVLRYKHVPFMTLPLPNSKYRFFQKNWAIIKKKSKLKQMQEKKVDVNDSTVPSLNSPDLKETLVLQR